MVFGIIFRKLQLQLHKEMVFWIKNAMISKRMVHAGSCRQCFCISCSFFLQFSNFSEDAMGGGKKRGRKTSRMTPPLVRYVFHPPRASLLCFSCTKFHDWADQKLFWSFWEGAFSGTFFLPPYVLPPPISWPNFFCLLVFAGSCTCQ